MKEAIKKLLLVEDDDAHAEIFEFYATEHCKELTIKRVSDGEAMMEFIDRGELKANDVAQIIFLDLNLPKFSGLEILEKLKEHVSTKQIPTVIFTSSDSSKDVNRAFQLGANSYLRKPLDPGEFQPLISKALDYWSLNERIVT